MAIKVFCYTSFILKRIEIANLGNFAGTLFQIEILKRLQRETFSDLMRLRDRQEKVEKVLSFNNTQRSSPLQENGTHVRGEVDILGALLLMSVIDNHSLKTLRRAGISTGIHSRLTFETTVRENDSLVAEFVANQKAKVDFGVDSGNELTLSKVLYKASVRDWMSAIVAPNGARCRDVATVASPSCRVCLVAIMCFYLLLV